MHTRAKVLRKQSKMLDEIEQERLAIERNFEILQKAKKSRLGKRKRRPKRSKRQ